MSILFQTGVFWMILWDVKAICDRYMKTFVYLSSWFPIFDSFYDGNDCSFLKIMAIWAGMFFYKDYYVVVDFIICVFLYVLSLSQSLSLSFPPSLSLSLFLYIYIYIYICVCVFLSLSLSVIVSVEPVLDYPSACRSEY